MKSKYARKLWAAVATAVAAVALFATSGHPSTGNGTPHAMPGCPVHGCEDK